MRMKASQFRHRLHISLLEGINNKIKVIERMAYGFRGDAYFFLKNRAAFPGISRWTKKYGQQVHPAGWEKRCLSSGSDGIGTSCAPTVRFRHEPGGISKNRDGIMCINPDC